MFNSDQDLKKVPGLRWRVAEDGQIIARPGRTTLKLDHLYFHGSGVLGIYYRRRTRRAAEYARKWWAERCGRVFDEDQADRQGPAGDWDGLILFQPATVKDIPAEFFKGRPRGVSFKPLCGGTPAQESPPGG